MYIQTSKNAPLRSPHLSFQPYSLDNRDCTANGSKRTVSAKKRNVVTAEPHNI